MLYLALLYGDQDLGTQPGTPEWDQEMAGYIAFGENYDDAIRGGAALHETQYAVTVRSGTGAPLVTTGPFAETTEVIGGYYVLEAESLDEAIDMVRQIPAAERANGGIELRPAVQATDTRPEGATMPPPMSMPDDAPPRWLALIHGKETEADVPGTAAWDEGLAAHGAFTEKAGDALWGGVAVHPVATATTVRVRDGEVQVTDGPFAEGAEVVGGFYLLAPMERDAAVAVAADIPAEAVELRPIMDFGD